MNKYILAPLCSALIVPGLGQILNGHIKKGLIIMGIVFALIVSFVIQAALVLQELLNAPSSLSEPSNLLIEEIRAWKHIPLLIILAGFGLIWVYSVLEALLSGIKIGRIKKMNGGL